MPTSREQLETQIQQAVTAGRMIEAIKMYRELHGVGLKEAKDAVDAMALGQRVCDLFHLTPMIK